MKDEGGRLKGFGYADFADRDSLVDVLTMELSVKNRKMRIDLASQAGKDRPERGGFDNDRGGHRGGRNDDPDAGRSDADDWRRGPPPPTRERDDGRDRYNGRDSYDRDRYNGRGSYDRDNRGGRGFSNYEPARERDGGRYGGFSRGGDRDDRGYSRDERRETPKERPRLNLAPRSKPVEEEEGGQAAQSSIFGGAKPVDTVKKEQEMEERLAKEQEEKEKALEEAKRNKPSAASIFGSAKPVDTTQREKEIEDKLSKMSTGEEEKKDDQPRAYRPPGRREEGDRRDDRGGYDRRDNRDSRGGGGGYDRRDNRGYDNRDRGYDNRDNRDRGYDRRPDNRRDGGYDRRDDRGGYDRRDDRGGYDRRDRGSSGYDRDRRDRDPRSVEKEERKTPEPAVKKYEEPKPLVSTHSKEAKFLLT